MLKNRDVLLEDLFPVNVNSKDFKSDLQFNSNIFWV